MANVGKARVVGLKEMQGAFAQISSAAGKGALRRAIVKAAAPIANAMSNFAPVEDGTLEESITVEVDSISLAKKAGDMAYHKVMTQGFSEATAAKAFRAAAKPLKGQYSTTADIGPSKEAPHAHLVEFGTGPRFHKSGKFVGSMPPDPFVRPAWDTQGGAVAQGRIREVLGQELAKSIARARARAAKKA